MLRILLFTPRFSMSGGASCDSRKTEVKFTLMISSSNLADIQLLELFVSCPRY